MLKYLPFLILTPTELDEMMKELQEMSQMTEEDINDLYERENENETTDRKQSI